MAEVKDTIVADVDSCSAVKMTEELGVKDNSSFWECNGWTFVAGVELLLLFAFVFALFKSKKTVAFDEFSRIKQESKNEVVDFSNLLNSAFNSGKLYDMLKAKCHPDRFATEPDKCKRANEIFQEITRNKNNIKKLEELKLQAEKDLNVKF